MIVWRFDLIMRPFGSLFIAGPGQNVSLPLRIHSMIPQSNKRGP
jgi:hypothetical protein